MRRPSRARRPSPHGVTTICRQGRRFTVTGHASARREGRRVRSADADGIWRARSRSPRQPRAGRCRERVDDVQLRRAASISGSWSRRRAGAAVDVALRAAPADVRRLVARRVVPVRERFGWSAIRSSGWRMVLAIALLDHCRRETCSADENAAARRPRRRHPAGRVSVDACQRRDAVRRREIAAGTDRWQRSMQFLRRAGRRAELARRSIAMVGFRAHRRTANPPHARSRTRCSSFSITFNTARRSGLKTKRRWDTNLELAIDWGLRLVDKDEESTAVRRTPSCL